MPENERMNLYVQLEESVEDLLKYGRITDESGRWIKELSVSIITGTLNRKTDIKLLAGALKDLPESQYDLLTAEKVVELIIILKELRSYLDKR